MATANIPASEDKDGMDVVDFKQKCRTESTFRNFKLICKDDVLYVNGHFLAELSPFFQAAFFGAFAEGHDQTMTLPVESPEDVLEFLAVVYGLKNVNEFNCPQMLHFSDIWNVDILRRKCQRFLDEGIMYTTPSVANCIRILEVALSVNCKHLMKNVVNRLAGSTNCQLTMENFLQKITDSTVVAAVYQSLHRRVDMEHSQLHVFRDELTGELLSPGAVARSGSVATFVARFGEPVMRVGGPVPAMYNPMTRSPHTPVGVRSTSTARVVSQRTVASQCNHIHCNTHSRFRCQDCGLQFCEAHTDAVGCPKNARQADNSELHVKVVPFNMNRVRVDKRVLFQNDTN